MPVSIGAAAAGAANGVHNASVSGSPREARAAEAGGGGTLYAGGQHAQSPQAPQPQSPQAQQQQQQQQQQQEGSADNRHKEVRELEEPCASCGPQGSCNTTLSCTATPRLACRGV